MSGRLILMCGLACSGTTTSAVFGDDCIDRTNVDELALFDPLSAD